MLPARIELATSPLPRRWHYGKYIAKSISNRLVVPGMVPSMALTPNARQKVRSIARSA